MEVRGEEGVVEGEEERWEGERWKGEGGGCVGVCSPKKGLREAFWARGRGRVGVGRREEECGCVEEAGGRRCVCTSVWGGQERRRVCQLAV